MDAFWFIIGLLFGAFVLGVIVGALGGSGGQRQYNDGYRDGRNNTGPRSLYGIH